VEERLSEPDTAQRRPFDRAVTGIILIVSLLACALGVYLTCASPTGPTAAPQSLDELAERAEQAWAQIPQTDADANEYVRDLRTKLHTARLFHKGGHIVQARELYETVLRGSQALLDAAEPSPETAVR